MLNPDLGPGATIQLDDDEDNTKPPWQSKTLWTNAAMAVYAGATGNWMLFSSSVTNIILRLVTYTGISLGA